MVMPTQELSLDAIALVGPTASGKTAAALAIAEHLERTHQLPVEIISMDSALVYRGMDIGTAKPEAHELAQVPHHLIDIIEPTQAYSAADFERDATRLIRDIRARGKLPLVVGGTMLYLKALRDGLNDLPQAQPVVREAIEQQALAQGWPALHAELAAVDPITAARLSPNDAQRISRALEIWRISGKALSAWFEESALQRDASQAALRMPVLSLEPTDRAWLHARIAQRFDLMPFAGVPHRPDEAGAGGERDGPEAGDQQQPRADRPVSPRQAQVGARGGGGACVDPVPARRIGDGSR